MRTLLNLLWLVLAGIWMAIAYAIAGVIMVVTIIGIPFGVQAFKLAVFTLWPFGRVLVPRHDRIKGLSALANIIWFVLEAPHPEQWPSSEQRGSVLSSAVDA